MKKAFLFVLIIPVLSLSRMPAAGSSKTAVVPGALPNPSAAHCYKEGGRFLTIKMKEGIVGYCIFKNASACKSWHFYNGTCKKGDCKITCRSSSSGQEGWYDCNGAFLYPSRCVSVRSAVQDKTSRIAQQVIRKYSTTAKKYDEISWYLAARWQLNNHGGPDDIRINSNLRDRILASLIAVYHARRVPYSRSIRDIGCSIYGLDHVNVKLDKKYAWVMNINPYERLIGNRTLDQFIEKYNLHTTYHAPNISFVPVKFGTMVGYINMEALAAELKKIDGIAEASISRPPGDGDQISLQKEDDLIKITYSYGWEDCTTRCRNRTYYIYLVDQNLKVTFIRKYKTLGKEEKKQ